MSPLLLVLASLGQYGATCTTAAQRVYVQPQTYPHGYGYQHAATVVKEVQFVGVEHDPFYGALAGDYLRAAKRVDEKAKREQDLIDQVGKLADAVAQLQRAVPAQQPAPPNPPAPAPVAPAPRPQAPPAPAPRPSTPTAAPAADPIGPPPPAVLSLLSARCAACHTGASAKGGFALFSAPNTLANLAIADLLRLDQVAYSAQMPPDRPLTTEEYSPLRAWIGEQTDLILQHLKTPGTK